MRAGRGTSTATRTAQIGAAILVAVGFGFGCAQILGADEHRDLAVVVSSDGGGVLQTFDAIAEIPDAGDPDACAPNQKRCDGTCVSKSAPEYGCSNEGCAPCSVPNALEVKCTEPDNKCAFQTCSPGWLACGPSTSGCTDQNSAPGTCGGCNTSCGGPFPLCASMGCTATCPAGTKNCSNSCVDVLKNATHCGDCGIACPTKLNGDPECLKGKCQIACRTGFAHCDLNPAGDCVPMQIFYKDVDGDGVGDAAQKQLACSAAELGPGWVTRAGDCHDGNKDVYPGQARLFLAAYITTTGAKSYDYDCNGIETEAPGVVHFPGCDTNCQGYGLTPANSGRTGSGINDYCGSTTSFKCAAGALSPQAGPAVTTVCKTDVASVPPNGCH